MPRSCLDAEQIKVSTSFPRNLECCHRQLIDDGIRARLRRIGLTDRSPEQADCRPAASLPLRLTQHLTFKFFTPSPQGAVQMSPFQPSRRGFLTVGALAGV